MQLRKNIVWNAAGNMIYLGFQWLITVLVTRLFGYEDAGILSLAMSLGALFSTFALFGIRSYQVSDVEGKYEDSTYVGFRGIACVISIGVCLAFSALNRYQARQFIVIFWYMIFRVVEAYADVLYGIAQKKERLDIAGKAVAIRGVCTFLLFLLGYFLMGELTWAVAFLAVGGCICLLAYDLCKVRKLVEFRLTDTWKNCMRLARETVPMCVYVFLLAAVTTTPKYILERMCDATALGAYASIFAPALLMQNLASYVYSPFIHSFALHYRNGNRKAFYKLLLRICSTVLGIGVAGVALGMWFGEPVLRFVFGETILEYVYLLTPILIGTVMVAYFGFFCMVQSVMRDFRGLVTGCIIATLLCCITTPFLIHQFGTNGASYGLISGTVGGSIWLLARILLWKSRTREEEKKGEET